jgi:uncharacterized protein involved in exopolysaccharide biosynthesis
MNDHPPAPVPEPELAAAPGGAIAAWRGGSAPVRGYPAGAPSDHGADDDIIDLREYWRLLMRRRATILLVVMFATVLALVATFNATPIYRSTTLLQIDRSANKVV